MAQRLLETDHVIDVEVDVSAEELRKLRQDNRRLDETLRDARNQLGQVTADKENLERSIRALRNQLSPLHRYLRALFGEIELAIGEEEFSAPSAPGATTATPASVADPRWESYKQTFPGVAARIIDALLAHQQMTYGQLKTLLRADYNTIKNSAARLRQAGAIVKEGTMCRLNR